jgi:hypothetical protein
MLITDLSDHVNDFELDLSVMQRRVWTDGVHVSEIIDRLYTDYRLRKPRNKVSVTQSDLEQWEKGFLWEGMFSTFWVQRINEKLQPNFLIAQQEFETDGIIGTPDFMDIRDESGLECKATTVSMNKRLDPGIDVAFPGWMWQMKAYCKLMEVRRYRLATLWLCGDYRPPFPKVTLHQFDFSRMEIEDNWAQFKSVAARLRKERGI